MSTPKKKPKLDGLPGKTIFTQEIRRILNLDERMITITANLWAEVTALVDDYFENHELDFQAMAKSVYDSILLIFSKISTFKESEGSKRVISQYLREYCASVHNFLAQKHIYTEFVRYYDLLEIEGRKKLQEIYKEKEEEVTEEVIGRKLAIRIGKRAQRDIEADKEDRGPANIKMIKSSKSFTIHHPQSTTSTPNTPKLQKEDYEILGRIADIKYRSTKQKSTIDIESIFNKARKEEKANSSLKRIPGAIQFLNNTILNDDRVFKNKYLWEEDESIPFINAMKYILSDYYQNCLVQIPTNFDDERTFFCEVIIPILKTFAIHNKNMTFRWCEKESKENKSSWLQMMVESSGAESNVTHSVEDSIKQIKSATDFLTFLKARFQDSSAYTFTRLRTPTLLLIRNQLTMTTTSLDWNGKWQVVDVRTATVPTTKEGKFNLIKLFELLANLKEIWYEQQQIVLELEAEAVGIGEEFDETVGDHFSYQDN
ncbi:hypothetical protein BD408DRAFT_444847 [Parasitella parasitica]|nr:hypothetical protein BD408DRAFT_444847 [Parasitella parasitica]